MKRLLHARTTNAVLGTPKRKLNGYIDGIEAQLDISNYLRLEQTDSNIYYNCNHPPQIFIYLTRIVKVSTRKARSLPFQYRL